MTSPLPSIYEGCIYINTSGPKPNELGFVITNDKASYVAKGDSICLFSVTKETALNEQQTKPCVPFEFGSSSFLRVVGLF